MNIKVERNGYEIGKELETMLRRFECVAQEFFPDWEMEHFYYGSKVIMTTIKGCGCEDAEFNITAKYVHLNSCTMTNAHYKLAEQMTYNDECHNGNLIELSETF